MLVAIFSLVALNALRSFAPSDDLMVTELVVLQRVRCVNYGSW